MAACVTCCLLVSVVVSTVFGQDLEVVGSSLQEQRVKPPEDLQPASTRHQDDQGYHRTHKSRGGNGYKNFDSFHKKDGDSFGYEKHAAFGDKDHGNDGGEYHHSSSYNSGDGGSHGRGGKPKMTSYHYESKTGTPNDPNYDPETYEGDYTELAPRKVKLEVTKTSGATGASQRPAVPGKRRMRVRKPKGGAVEPQTAGTEEDAEYDYYYDSGEGGDDASGEAGYYSGGDYESEGAADYDY